MTVMEAIWTFRLNYFDFSGRTSRRDFGLQILGYLAFFIPYVVVQSATFIMYLNGESTPFSEDLRTFVTPAGPLIALLLACPFYALCSRRLHDTNRSAKWMLACWLPVAGFFIWFVVFFFFSQRGDPHENQYGAPPYLVREGRAG